MDRPLEEVWAWKEDMYRQVKHLKLKDQINALANQATKTTRRLGFKIQKPASKAR